MDTDLLLPELGAADEFAAKREESPRPDVDVDLADDLEQLVGGVPIKADENLGLGDDVVDSEVVDRFQVVLQLKRGASSVLECDVTGAKWDGFLAL